MYIKVTVALPCVDVLYDCLRQAMAPRMRVTHDDQHSNHNIIVAWFIIVDIRRPCLHATSVSESKKSDKEWGKKSKVIHKYINVCQVETLHNC
jgi:hypothetical protein